MTYIRTIIKIHKTVYSTNRKTRKIKKLQ